MTATQCCEWQQTEVFPVHTGNVELDGLTKMAAVPGLSTTQLDVRVFCYLFSLLNQTISFCLLYWQDFSMSVPKLQLLAALAYHPKETCPGWMSNPDLKRMVSGIQLVIEW